MMSQITLFHSFSGLNNILLCMYTHTQCAHTHHVFFIHLSVNGRICCLHVFSSVQSLSRIWLFAIPWTAACQASLSITNSRSPPKPMSITSVMPSNHLILSCPLLLLPSIFPRIRVFSNESALRIRWPKDWSFNFSASVLRMNTQDWSPLGWTGLISLQSKDFQESSPTPQVKSINSLVLSFFYSPTLTSIHDHWKNHSLD